MLAVSVAGLVGLALAGGATAHPKAKGHPKPPPKHEHLVPQGLETTCDLLSDSAWTDGSYAGSQYIELLNTEGVGPPSYTGSTKEDSLNSKCRAGFCANLPTCRCLAESS